MIVFGKLIFFSQVVLWRSNIKNISRGYLYDIIWNSEMEIYIYMVRKRGSVVSIDQY